MKFSLQESLEKLKNVNEKFTAIFTDKTLEIEIYKPEKIDLQQPHKKDEVYIISSGSGTFFNDGERVAFTSGDVLFVPAGKEHRFENFTDDFSTWVIFYGPEYDID